MISNIQYLCSFCDCRLYIKDEIALLVVLIKIPNMDHLKKDF